MSDIKILIVEDEAIVAEDLASHIERLGYIISDVVDSGEEAIAAATTTRPDLVLMDIRLSGEIDGTEATRQIYNTLGIPIVYLTAYADEQTLSRIKSTNPYGYIQKPFSTPELRAAIEIALTRHQTEMQVQQKLADVRQSQATARSDRELRSQYLSLASRELQNPLMAASTIASHLRGHAFSEEKIRDYLCNIKTAITDVDRLLEQLLLLEKIDSHRILLKPEKFDAVERARVVADELSSTNQLVCACGLEELFVYFDPQIFQHILKGLLSEAAHRSPAGATIWLKVMQTGDALVLQVKDRSDGMLDNVSTTFHAGFQQKENAQSAPDLGLAIVERLVDCGGGEIETSTTPGEGMTRSVTLPIDSAAAAVADERLLVPEPPEGLPAWSLRRAIEHIHRHLDRDLKLLDIAAVVGMSQSHFSRLFKQALGISLRQYIIQQRIERAKYLLKQNLSLPISEIALQCGFANQSHFTKSFRQSTGLTPKAYREN